MDPYHRKTGKGCSENLKSTPGKKTTRGSETIAKKGALRRPKKRTFRPGASSQLYCTGYESRTFWWWKKLGTRTQLTYTEKKQDQLPHPQIKKEEPIVLSVIKMPVRTAAKRKKKNPKA